MGSVQSIPGRSRSACTTTPLWSPTSSSCAQTDSESSIHDAASWVPHDLVVEILSPSNRDDDRSLKRKRYLSGGVPELWIVDADENAIDVWRPGLVEPERPRGAVTWDAGERTFEVVLDDVFQS